MTEVEKRKVAICRHCGQPMLFSFCLPYCEWVCVPCGVGVGMIDNDRYKYISEKKYQALRKKYAKDIHKRSWETAKAGGGTCKNCGKEFNCPTCKEAENHKYQYWGKNKSGRY